MKKNVGLWIDHRKAVILVLAERKEEVRRIESNMEKHVRFRGGVRGKTPFMAQYYAAEDRETRRQTGQLDHYFGEIVKTIRDAESVFIMGPGEAKHELEKRMTRSRIKNRIAKVETADKLTDRQIMARVRKFFKERDA
jgi:stalled ribosome rescue protein Dom34